MCILEKKNHRMYKTERIRTRSSEWQMAGEIATDAVCTRRKWDGIFHSFHLIVPVESHAHSVAMREIRDKRKYLYFNIIRVSHDESWEISKSVSHCRVKSSGAERRTELSSKRLKSAAGKLNGKTENGFPLNWFRCVWEIVNGELIMSHKFWSSSEIIHNLLSIIVRLSAHTIAEKSYCSLSATTRMWFFH